jgi:hypothetical protein
MQHIDQGDVERLLPFPALVRTLRVRRNSTHWHLPGHAGRNRTRYYGVKLVNNFPSNARQGLPGLHAV